MQQSEALIQSTTKNKNANTQIKLAMLRRPRSSGKKKKALNESHPWTKECLRALSKPLDVVTRGTPELKHVSESTN